MSDQAPLFEAVAFQALERAQGHLRAFEKTMEDAADALEAAKDTTTERDCRRVIELQRLTAARLAGVLRRLGEGQR